MVKITTPVDRETVNSLRSGEQLLLQGTVYTARDAAHKRLINLINDGKKLPVDLQGQFLYYTGPTPPRPGMALGSAGPTTSSRMDPYTPQLIEATGIAGIIGKGNRSKAVIDAFVAYSCVYCAATGGAGALLGACIRSAEIICYEELGPEAIYKLTVVDFPVIVAIDTCGQNCYVDGPAAWKNRFAI